MKTLKYFFLAAISVCLASCGGNNNSDEKTEIIVSPVETEVSGDMEGCFTVVDKEYKAVGDWENGIITVEIERTSEDLPFELNGRDLCSFSETLFAANVQVGFGIEFLDEDGNILDKVSANAGGLSGPYDSDECVALAKLKPGKKGTIRFSVSDSAKDAVGFRITSAYEENEASNGGSYSSSDDDSYSNDDDDDSYSSSMDDDDDSYSSSSGSEDWDELLDSYDSYVTKYISYMKRAANGDLSAMSEYPALMQKAENFSKKMQNAQGDMSSSQWARYMRITNKMTQAAANMH